MEPTELRKAIRTLEAQQQAEWCPCTAQELKDLGAELRHEVATRKAERSRGA